MRFSNHTANNKSRLLWLNWVSFQILNFTLHKNGNNWNYRICNYAIFRTVWNKHTIVFYVFKNITKKQILKVAVKILWTPSDCQKWFVKKIALFFFLGFHHTYILNLIVHYINLLYCLLLYFLLLYECSIQLYNCCLFIYAYIVASSYT